MSGARVLHVFKYFRPRFTGEGIFVERLAPIFGALRQAVADTNHDYCYACYTGDYPTELINIEELMGAKDRRG